MNNTELIHNYINSVIKNEDFVKYDIEIPGQTDNGEGYMSSVIFVSVHGIKKDGQKKKLNYVSKISSSVQALREKIPLGEIFESEIYVYEKILPVFKNFQNEMGVKEDLLSLLPNCYFSNIMGHQEIIILENMKSMGFGIWDKFEPLPYEYIKVILENYGKWHAFSFAVKHKRPQTFTTLQKGIKFEGWYTWISKLKLPDVIYRFFKEFKDALKDEQEIMDNLNLTRNDVRHICTDLFFEDSEDHVIIHGDGWTNNFMFKVEDTGNINVCFLDWQFFSLGSPVFDLSYFIYTCVDTNKYQNVEKLLQIYHSSLSANLKRLGCDAADIFPYDRLKYHWKKFSSFGILIGGSYVLKYAFAEGNEAPDFVEIISEGRDIAEFFNFIIRKKRDLCYKRAKDNYLHYIRNLRLD